jgi:hypothetical protein
MLTAPLPSAPEVGGGWRGVDLRRIHPLDQFDPLVLETAARSEAALGIHIDEAVAYVIAAARDEEPVRFVLGVDPSAPPEAAEAILEHAGAGGSGRGRRKAAAQAFAAWSAHAPQSVEADAVLALMGPEHGPAEAVSWLVALLGVQVPNEPIPDPLDLQSVARDQLAAEPARGKKKRRRRRG